MEKVVREGGYPWSKPRRSPRGLRNVKEALNKSLLLLLLLYNTTRDWIDLPISYTHIFTQRPHSCASRADIKLPAMVANSVPILSRQQDAAQA